MVAQMVEHQIVILAVEGSIPFHQPKKKQKKSNKHLTSWPSCGKMDLNNERKTFLERNNGNEISQ
tara:strand:+ start:444 stop:638 length:195 start_codon:yes stop_codon:yes gene_type:complete